MLDSIRVILGSIPMRKVCFDWRNLLTAVDLDQWRHSRQSAGVRGAGAAGEQPLQ